MAAPIIPHSNQLHNPDDDQREEVAYCPGCTEFYWPSLGHHCDPLRAARGIFNALVCSVVIFACIAAIALLWVNRAQAREGTIEPVRAPRALIAAREACPNNSTIPQCRSALRRAYDAVAWQRAARQKAQAYTSRDVVLDAITWAAAKYHVPAWQMRTVGNCESHLYWLATNGQYASWAQLSSRHRSDPIIQRLTWRDPYAVADHVARYVKQHGWNEWQCSPGGGLRW